MTAKREVEGRLATIANNESASVLILLCLEIRERRAATSHLQYCHGRFILMRRGLLSGRAGARVEATAAALRMRAIVGCWIRR